MYLVEIETKLGKDGVIQLPDKEREATGLHEGDEICLLYLVKREEERQNHSGEFILEKK